MDNTDVNVNAAAEQTAPEEQSPLASADSQGGNADGSNEAAKELNNMKEAVSKKEAENKELFDRLQRMAAEFDNYRKRTQKEKEKLYVDSVVEVVERFLPVVDNLDRALKTSNPEENQCLREGVLLVYRQLADILEKLDVRPIEAVGQPFNPELHHAVMHCEDDSCGASTITEEFQKGYTYKGETVIRHSMVKVAN